jgi:hypothetical protein
MPSDLRSATLIRPSRSRRLPGPCRAAGRSISDGRLHTGHGSTSKGQRDHPARAAGLVPLCPSLGSHHLNIHASPCAATCSRITGDAISTALPPVARARLRGQPVKVRDPSNRELILRHRELILRSQPTGHRARQQTQFEFRPQSARARARGRHSTLSAPVVMSRRNGTASPVS